MRQVTVVEHLLLRQKERPMASGRFTRLLTELILSAKIIDREVSKAGLLDVLGATGEVNIQGEIVQKLDDFANRVIIRRMERAGVLCAMVSEENADFIEIPRQYPVGDYILIFDPPGRLGQYRRQCEHRDHFQHLSTHVVRPAGRQHQRSCCRRAPCRLPQDISFTVPRR
jgi:D-fructose 1,6-bisphosphatase (EC 3.1.3.11)